MLLADAKQIVWYRAPNWEKFVMAENLTPKDNVCIAARDLDGDGKADLAVFNPTNGAWTIKRSSMADSNGASIYTMTLGSGTDIPLPTL